MSPLRLNAPGPDAAVRVEYLPPYDVKLLTADYLITRARQ